MLQQNAWGDCPRLKVIVRLWRLTDKMSVLPSQSRWAIDEFPWHSKSFRQMRSERFHAENFRRVMSTEEKIHAELLRRQRQPSAALHR